MSDTDRLLTALRDMIDGLDYDDSLPDAVLTASNRLGDVVCVGHDAPFGALARAVDVALRSALAAPTVPEGSCVVPVAVVEAMADVIDSLMDGDLTDVTDEAGNQLDKALGGAGSGVRFWSETAADVRRFVASAPPPQPVDRDAREVADPEPAVAVAGAEPGAVEALTARVEALSARLDAVVSAVTTHVGAASASLRRGDGDGATRALSALAVELSPSS